MKKFPVKTIAVGIASFCVTQGVSAQSLSSEHQGSTQSPAQQSGSVSSSQKSASDSKTTDVSEPIRLSKLIGVSVTSKDGDSLGQVQDLVIDPETGKIRFALVGKGFMSGAGETIYPLPWRAINLQSEKQFLMNVDKSKLSSMPLWSQTEIEQPDYTLRIFRFYNIDPSSESPGDVGTSGQSQKGSSSGSSDSSGSNDGSTSRGESKDSTQPQDKE